ncbi:mitochondrial carrier [Chytriomyces sp. MP71]|nr:mitochondrial carrier [Chytriomyces sp. MP71]
MPSADNTPTSVAADLVFGSVSGSIAKVLEHPADTVKTLLQVQPDSNTSRLHAAMPNSTLQVCRMIMKTEGVKGFYKGLPPQLAGAMIETSALFVFYNQIQAAVRCATNAPIDSPLSTAQLTASGFLAGGLISFVLTPIELVKCKLQVQAPEVASTQAIKLSRPPLQTLIASTNFLGLHKGRISIPNIHFGSVAPIMAAHMHTSASAPAKPHFSGSMDVVRHVIQTDGMRGIYRGHSGTVLRESVGNGVWFGTYELACGLLGGGRNKDDLTMTELLLAGAGSGMVGTLACYPADLVKTRMQTMESGVSRASFTALAVDIWKTEGTRGFFRGAGITVARSAPSSAIIFLTYETLKRNFSF